MGIWVYDPVDALFSADLAGDLYIGLNPIISTTFTISPVVYPQTEYTYYTGLAPTITTTSLTNVTIYAGSIDNKYKGFEPTIVVPSTAGTTEDIWTDKQSPTADVTIADGYSGEIASFINITGTNKLIINGTGILRVF